MKKETIYLRDPPRLLLGAGAVFWGGLSGHALPGLLMALVLEARHWIGSRWDFGEKGFVRAWQLSVVLGFVAGFVMRFQMSPAMNLLEIFTWITVFLLPVVLSSLYSEKAGIPVTTFSFFARRKLLQERAEGWERPGNRVFLGYPFLGLLVVMAGLGLRDVFWYGGGAAVLIFVGVFSAWPGGRRRPWAWFFAAGLSMTLALAIASLINLLYYYVLDGGWYKEESRSSALESTTFLGRVGEIKLNPKIRWRLFVDEGPRPDLLRLASYNVFGLNSWISAGEVPDRRRGQEGAQRLRATARDFTGLFVASGRANGQGRFTYLKEDLQKTTEVSSRYRLRGDLEDEDLVPLDLGARALDEFSTLGVEYNVMGSTRVVDPDYLVSDFVVESGGKAVSDEDPYLSDLQVERRRGDRNLRRDALVAGLRDFWRGMGIDHTPGDLPGASVDVIEQRVRIARLKQVFRHDFQYSLTQKGIPEKYHGMSLIPYFLKYGKSGHCEYFGTATTLLLREAGIPTRYCVGYAVVEHGREDNEYVIRGKHAHAWCRAYLGGEWVEEETPDGDKEWRCRGGQWVDVDTTPSIWKQEDRAKLTWARRLIDWWQTRQENFTVWRSQAAHRSLINAILVGGGLLLLVYVYWRLRSTRLRREKAGKDESAPGRPERVEGALRNIEIPLAQLVGVRARGETMATWLHRAGRELPDLARELDAAAAVYQHLRFDPESEIDEESGILAEKVGDLHVSLRQVASARGIGWWRRMIFRVKMALQS